MSRLPATFLIVLLSALTATAAGEEGYCHDEAAARQWEELVEKHPQDLELQRLHALRVGICIKIDKGSSSLERGVMIFEQDQQALLRKRNEEERAKHQERAH